MRSLHDPIFAGLITAMAFLGCSDGVTPVVLPSPATPTISVTGTFTYESVRPTAGGLNYGATVPKPGRGLVVEVVHATNGTTLASGTTDATTGAFNVPGVPDNAPYYVRVKAQLLRSGTPAWNMSVVDNTNANALYAARSAGTTPAGSTAPLAIHATSGWGASSYTSPRIAAPFAILDVVARAIELVLTADGNSVFPPLTIHWSTANVPVSPANYPAGQIQTSSYVEGVASPGLYILGAENNDTDEYDTHIIAHEFGHYFEAKFSRADSLGGGHAQADVLDPRVAFGEGFGNALAGMVMNDSQYFDTSGAMQQTTGLAFDVDDNGLAEASEGWWSETSVQAILYDLWDPTNDGADTVSLGFGPIHSVLTGPQKSSPAFTILHTFIHALRAAAPASAGGIDALVAGENVTTTFVDEWDSNGTTAGEFAALKGSLYNALTIGAAPVELCTALANGKGYNGAGNRRFVYVDVATPGNHTVTVSPVDAAVDPWVGYVVGGQTTQVTDASQAGFAETLTRSLGAGRHLFELAHFGHTSNQGGAFDPTQRCMNVSIAAGP